MIDYESPITQIVSDMQMGYENGVLKAVQNVGFHVNKEELTKALAYDRGQYDKGYEDGLNADKWIPCSEQFPKKYAYVLVCDREGDIYIAQMYENEIFGNIWRQWNGGELRQDWVIAWQPLPASYIPKED